MVALQRYKICNACNAVTPHFRFSMSEKSEFFLSLGLTKVFALIFWRFAMKNKRFGVGLDAELRQPLMRKVASINLELREDSCTFLQKNCG